MHAVAVLVMIAGAAGALLTYTGNLNVAPFQVWAGIAVVGVVVTVLTRRPGD